MTTKTKVCKHCGKTKPVVDFPRDKKRKDGISDWCKKCWKDYRDSRIGKHGRAKSVKATKAAKTAAKGKAVKAKSAKKDKVDIGSVPAGVTVRPLTKLSELPSKYKLFSWVGHGKIAEYVASFKSKFGFSPSMVLRFSDKYYIETNVLATEGS